MPDAHNGTSHIELTDVERAELVSMARSRSLPTGLALRARIVLACEGPGIMRTAIATPLGIDRNTVSKWRGRYARGRIAGLYDELRPGRPRTADDEKVAVLIDTTLHTKAADGATHWSFDTRSLGCSCNSSRMHQFGSRNSSREGCEGQVKGCHAPTNQRLSAEHAFLLPVERAFELSSCNSSRSTSIRRSAISYAAMAESRAAVPVANT
jgi:hypothetical protein